MKRPNARAGDGESSGTGERRRGCRAHATTVRERAARVEKVFRDPAYCAGDLAVAAPCRVSANNRARLRSGGCTTRISDIRTRGCDPWNACGLPRACRDLASAAASGTALMKAATRRSLRRVWRTMTWPLSGHVVFALGTGLASGATAARYPDVIAPPYAAIVGTFVLYPMMVVAWWRLHRPGR